MVVSQGFYVTIWVVLVLGLKIGDPGLPDHQLCQVWVACFFFISFFPGPHPCLWSGVYSSLDFCECFLEMCLPLLSWLAGGCTAPAQIGCSAHLGLQMCLVTGSSNAAPHGYSVSSNKCAKPKQEGRILWLLWRYKTPHQNDTTVRPFFVFVIFTKTFLCELK